MGRRKARQTAFKSVYQIEYMEKNEGNIHQDEINRVLEFCYAEDNNSDEEKEFVEGIINGVVANIEKIDSIILDKLKGWNMDRIFKVDLAVLRLAIFEIIFTDVPVKVAANEAVELAKEFGNDDSSAFVNGVLAKVIENKE